MAFHAYTLDSYNKSHAREQTEKKKKSQHEQFSIYLVEPTKRL